LLRVHDVAETRDLVLMWEALKAQGISDASQKRLG
jgi:dihydropteroate synthase